MLKTGDRKGEEHIARCTKHAIEQPSAAFSYTAKMTRIEVWFSSLERLGFYSRINNLTEACNSIEVHSKDERKQKVVAHI